MTARDRTEAKMMSDAHSHTSVLVTTPAREKDARGAVLADLHEFERLFAAHEWPERGAFLRAQRSARARALELLAGCSDAEETHTALLVAATELFGALRVELAASPQDAAHLVARLEEVTGLSRIAVAREVLRAPELLALSPVAAVEAQLGMLMAFAPLRSASLWTLDASERLKCTHHVGDSRPSRGAQRLATLLLAGETPDPSARHLLLGLPVGHPEQPVGALVGRANAGGRELSHALMGEAVPMLDALMQRDILLAENVASERALVEASERKLTRLGFDLHDGPIQDVAVLAEDLRLFRDQLESVLGPLKQHKLVRGRIEDLHAQLVALDAELRRLSSEVQAASVLLSRPFPTALRARIQAFAARTGIKPRLTIDGEMNLLSTSQQIALLNIIQEALSNVREHAQATDVEVTVSASGDGVTAKVIDDGRGFDLEPTLMLAAREGRIGLLAMSERVRLLGGQCKIESRPGGPTVVSVALERWLPMQVEPQPKRKRQPSRVSA
jgi:signal transduction histidine kinase